MQIFKNLDIESAVVICITFVLFVLALIIKGLTHEILLEAAVFLVSVKLIIMAGKSNVMKKSIETKLDAIHDSLVKIDECNNRTEGEVNRTELEP